MKRILLFSLLLTLVGVLPGLCDEAVKLEAFPGAEGYGRYVTGGRGGKVYHVTTLEDNNQPGSFRHAVSQSGVRTIVFDVSGNIHLTSTLTLRNGNVTIAGQTAPGDGICVTDYPFELKADNVIIRFMRFRLGNKNVTKDGADGWDGLGSLDRKNIIIDHCSVSWSIDECLSFCGNHNTTVQWCIASQSLVNAGHSKSAHGYGGNWGGEYASYHHNLMAHHTSRTPRLGPRYTTQDNEVMDMRNNVLYNYNGESCYGGEAMNVNIVNNYYKPGPGNQYAGKTKESRIAAIGIRNNEYIEKYADYKPTLHKVGTYYVDGNDNYNLPSVLKDNWQSGVYDQIKWSDWDDLADTDAKRLQLEQNMRLDLPVEYVYTTTHSASDAFNRVMDYAGASLSRDALDKIIIEDARNNTAKAGTGANNRSGFIDTPADVVYPEGTELDGPLPVLKSSAAKTDTDGDGIPDEWETANGLDPNDAADGAKATSAGFTNLEVYINSLVSHIMEGGNAGGKMLNGELTFADAAVQLPEYKPSDDPVEEPGETYEWEISDGTHTTGDTGTFMFENGVSMSSSNSNRGYAKGSGKTGNCIKFARNEIWTITVPEGKVITSVNFNGWANKDDQESYIASINDTTYPADSYVFVSRTEEKPSDHTIKIDPAREVRIKLGGTESVLVLKLGVADKGSSGIDDVVVEPAGDGKIYNIMGIEVFEPLRPGIYIKDGRKFIVR